MGHDGARAALGDRLHEGRRGGPHERRDHARPAMVRERGRERPAADRGEGRRKDERPGDRAIRIAEADGTEQPEHEVEGVAMARLARAQGDPPRRRMVPDRAETRGDRQQAAAGYCNCPQEREEREGRAHERDRGDDDCPRPGPSSCRNRKGSEIVVGVSGRLGVDVVAPRTVADDPLAVRVLRLEVRAPIVPDVLAGGPDAADDPARHDPRTGSVAAALSQRNQSGQRSQRAGAPRRAGGWLLRDEAGGEAP
ncbi:MAG: hypothetical protein HOQ07_03740 [Sinomonas sp.]|nr:hypothetical protein [Sinomonas sp.]